MYNNTTVYIWRNQVDRYAFLNGSETMVIGNKRFAKCEDGVLRMVWDTSTDLPESVFGPNFYMLAYEGDLIPRKGRLPGEQKVFEQFLPKVLELA